MGENVPTSGDLPDELLTYEQWVCWRFQERNGKQTKVPVNPNNGSFGSTTNPDSWTTFEAAREYALGGAADGLGFVFTADDPFVGVDLDDCRIPETETITDEATGIVESLSSYTEVSPSGTGVHVLLTGTLPGERNRQGWIELYDEARFFTVTGDHVDGTPATIEDRTVEVETVHATHVAQTQQPEETMEENSPSTTPTMEDGAETVDHSETGGESKQCGEDGLSDDELIERAQTAANGEKFTRLWRGQTTGYESHSEADMALCALLAFWTGGDSTQIDRLFRDSGLMREKWDKRHFADGSTYGEKTIDRVLAGTEEFYEPKSASSSARSSANAETTPTTDESTAEAVALEDEVSELKAREEKHLSIISDLQTQVEQLEAENERLEDKLVSVTTDATDTQSDESDTAPSIVTRLQRWVGWNQ